MTERTASAVAFRFDPFLNLPLRHGMSGRDTGSPEEGSVGHGRDSDSEAIEANRSAFLADVGIDSSDLVIAHQTHGNRVQVVTVQHRGRGLYPEFDGFHETDAMVANDPAVALGVIVADCVPLLLYDTLNHALGVVHAGWKGTVLQIAAEALQTMADTYGTRAEHVRAGIGPSIGPCCYEVGDDVIARWLAADVECGNDAMVQHDGSYYFDLWTANRLVLRQAGLLDDNIIDAMVCVRCNYDRFFSHRASKQAGARPGRMLMVAQLDRVSESPGIER